MTPSAAPDLYKRPRFPGEIIRHAVWLYFRFPLSQRDGEELLFVRGVLILDVDGAAALLAVSSSTIYRLARPGKIAATRVGRAWHFARSNLMQWVANGRQADQGAALLTKGRWRGGGGSYPQDLWGSAIDA